MYASKYNNRLLLWTVEIQFHCHNLFTTGILGFYVSYFGFYDYYGKWRERGEKKKSSTI